MQTTGSPNNGFRNTRLLGQAILCVAGSPLGTSLCTRTKMTLAQRPPPCTAIQGQTCVVKPLRTPERAMEFLFLLAEGPRRKMTTPRWHLDSLDCDPQTQRRQMTSKKSFRAKSAGNTWRWIRGLLPLRVEVPTRALQSLDGLKVRFLKDSFDKRVRNDLPVHLPVPPAPLHHPPFRFSLILEKVQGATGLGATGLRASERKSASERVSERTSENLSKISENLENLWKPLEPLKTSKNLSKPLKNLWKPSLSETVSETLSEADFLSVALSPVAPILLPVKLSPIILHKKATPATHLNPTPNPSPRAPTGTRTPLQKLPPVKNYN